MAKELELLSKHYEEMTVTPGGAQAVGEFVTYNDVNGFLIEAIDSDQVSDGEDRALIVKAEKVKCVKLAGAVWVTGENVAFVVATSNVSNVIGSDIFCGHVIEPAESAAVVGYISFDGMLTYATSS